MAKKFSSAVGIDIGSYSIKVAEVRHKGGEAEIVSLGMVDTPEGSVDHTGVYNSEAVGDALKALMKQSGISVNQGVLSLAGQASVLVRTLEVPRMTPAELKEHMQWEINRNIPFAESNVLSDYRVLPDDDPNAANMEVVMAIAPQSAIDTLIATVRRAGKQAVGIDVEPLAIARSLEVSHGPDLQDQVVCIVEVGCKTTAINIYRNGKLLMPRQIPIGGELFTKSISDNLAVSIEEAEREKRLKGKIPDSEIEAAEQGGFLPTYGGADAMSGETQQFSAYNPFSDGPPVNNPFVEPPVAGSGPGEYNPFAAPLEATPTSPFSPSDETEVSHVPFNPFDTEIPESAPLANASHGSVDEDPDVARIYNAFRPVLEEFVAEVRRSVDYFRSRGGDVNRLFLAGGGAKLKGLDRYIAANLHLPCELYDASARLKLNSKKVAQGYLEDNREEFAVALGTALHVMFD